MGSRRGGPRPPEELGAPLIRRSALALLVALPLAAPLPAASPRAGRGALALSLRAASKLVPGYQVTELKVPAPADAGPRDSGLERSPLPPRLAPDHSGGFYFMDPLAFAIRHHDATGKVVATHRHERAKTLLFGGRRFVCPAPESNVLVLHTMHRELVKWNLTSGQVEHFHNEERIKGWFDRLATDGAGRVWAGFQAEVAPGRFRPHVRLLGPDGRETARLEGILANRFAVGGGGWCVGVSLEEPKLALVAFDPSGKPVGQLAVPQGDRQSEVLAITPAGDVLVQTGGAPRTIPWKLKDRTFTVRTGVKPGGLVETAGAGRIFVLEPPSRHGAALVVQRHQPAPR